MLMETVKAKKKWVESEIGSKKLLQERPSFFLAPPPRISSYPEVGESISWKAWAKKMREKCGMIFFTLKTPEILKALFWFYIYMWIWSTYVFARVGASLFPPFSLSFSLSLCCLFDPHCSHVAHKSLVFFIYNLKRWSETAPTVSARVAFIKFKDKRKRECNGYSGQETLPKIG